MAPQNKAFKRLEPLKEGAVYRVLDSHMQTDIARYTKGRFLFFGWEIPEKPEHMLSWKEVTITLKKKRKKAANKSNTKR